MTTTEAAEIIELVATSLRQDPGQFNLSIEAVGQKIASYGGTGLAINAAGGGPGSTTIGQQVSASLSGVQILQMQGVFNSEVDSLIKELEEIAQQLRLPEPDTSRIRAILNSFTNTWVPGVIIGVVGNVVTKVLGL